MKNIVRRAKEQACVTKPQVKQQKEAQSIKAHYGQGGY